MHWTFIVTIEMEQKVPERLTSDGLNVGQIQRKHAGNKAKKVYLAGKNAKPWGKH